VWKLDRLGRNMLHILETVKALTDRGVTLVSTVARPQLRPQAVSSAVVQSLAIASCTAASDTVPAQRR
jgi:DNA invertase Pin-like site-specific DNA recombinase